jgi:hypothetical protein
MPCSAVFIPRSGRPEARIPALLLVRECRPRQRLRTRQTGRTPSTTGCASTRPRTSPPTTSAPLRPSSAPHPSPFQRRGLLDEQTVDDMLTWHRLIHDPPTTGSYCSRPGKPRGSGGVWWSCLHPEQLLNAGARNVLAERDQHRIDRPRQRRPVRIRHVHHEPAGRG